MEGERSFQRDKEEEGQVLGGSVIIFSTKVQNFAEPECWLVIDYFFEISWNIGEIAVLVLTYCLNS